MSSRENEIHKERWKFRFVSGRVTVAFQSGALWRISSEFIRIMATGEASLAIDHARAERIGTVDSSNGPVDFVTRLFSCVKFRYASRHDQ